MNYFKQHTFRATLNKVAKALDEGKVTNEEFTESLSSLIASYVNLDDLNDYFDKLISETFKIKHIESASKENPPPPPKEKEE